MALYYAVTQYFGSGIVVPIVVCFSSAEGAMLCKYVGIGAGAGCRCCSSLSRLLAVQGDCKATEF